MRHHMLACAVVVLCLFIGAACNSEKNNMQMFGYTVKIGAQSDTAQQLLGEMYRALIEDKTLLKAELIYGMDSPELIGAFLNDEIQIATLYRGRFPSRSAAAEWIHPDSDLLMQAQAASRSGYRYQFLNPLTIGTRYAIMTGREQAEQNGWTQISDLQASDEPPSLAVDQSWLHIQANGYAALRDQYGIRFSPMFAATANDMYEAWKSGRADVILADSSDLRNKQLDLVELVDDQGFFPYYQPVPTIRSTTLRDYPDLAEAIETLRAHLDTNTFARLKQEVETNGIRVKTVAETFLLEQGLLQYEPGDPELMRLKRGDP